MGLYFFISSSAPRPSHRSDVQKATMWIRLSLSNTTTRSGLKLGGFALQARHTIALVASNLLRKWKQNNKVIMVGRSVHL